jgi:uncharacterized protein YgiM (DUF1202 family)
MKKFIILLIILSMLACMTPAVLLPLPTATAQSVSTKALAVTLTPKCQHGIVIVDRLNLRSAPSYLSPADGIGLIRGQVVTVLDAIGDWYQVETQDGRKGYAYAKYIEVC